MYYIIYSYFTKYVNIYLKIINIIIYNIIGSVIKEIRTVNSTERINLQDYAKGLYMIKITNGNRSIIKKVILN